MCRTQPVGDEIINTNASAIAIDSLARLAARKARLLADATMRAVTAADDGYDNRSLRDWLDAFRKTLISGNTFSPDISPADFADAYAQTITYGMFASRAHCPDGARFSRAEAAKY
ncbi:MAG: hypothetical protein LBR38_04785, partial [Synergistaceae bacterium]|nr:hypothetical protein [Synergistaceae bacterium]